MAIDFRLTSHQRALQLESRQFAADVITSARTAELLPTPEERFRATKPVYQAMVAAGFLRKCIPAPAGGDNTGLIDMAIMAEEFYNVNAGVPLTRLGTVLGLLPIFLEYVGAGQPIAEAILEEEWSAASRVLLHRMLPSATSPRPTRPKLCRKRTEAQARAFKVACWPRLSICDA